MLCYRIFFVALQVTILVLGCLGGEFSVIRKISMYALHWGGEKSDIGYSQSITSCKNTSCYPFQCGLKESRTEHKGFLIRTFQEHNVFIQRGFKISSECQSSPDGSLDRWFINQILFTWVHTMVNKLTLMKATEMGFSFLILSSYRYQTMDFIHIGIKSSAK